MLIDFGVLSQRSLLTIESWKENSLHIGSYFRPLKNCNDPDLTPSPHNLELYCFLTKTGLYEGWYS